MRGRPEEALRVVQQAMRLNPHYPAMYLRQLGLAYRLTGAVCGGDYRVEGSLSRNPNHLAAYTRPGLRLPAAVGLSTEPGCPDVAQALAAAQRAVALNDSSSGAHTVLGSVYLWQKQYEQAIAEMERAIALDPNRLRSYAVLAEVLGREAGQRKPWGWWSRRCACKPTLVADTSAQLRGCLSTWPGRPEEAIPPLKQFPTQLPQPSGSSPGPGGGLQ